MSNQNSDAADGPGARRAQPEPDATQPMDPVPGGGYPPPVEPLDAPEEEKPSRLPLIIGIVVALAVVGIIAYLVFGGDDGTAEPAPAPTTVATTPTESPSPSETPTEPAPTETEASTEPATEAPPAGTTEPVAPPPATETTVEETEPAVELEELTEADLPETLAGYTLAVIEELFIYESDTADDTILLSALGIPAVDPAWLEATFPDSEQIAENAACSIFEDNAQACFVHSDRHGVISLSGEPGIDITVFVEELAEHFS